MKKKYVIIIAAAVLAAAALSICAYLWLFSGPSGSTPVKNTFEAVLGLDKAQKANQIRIDAKLGSDIIPTLNRNTQDISLRIGRDKDGSVAVIPEIKVGSTSKKAAVVCSNKTQEVLIESDFLKDSYTFGRNSLKEQLDRSVFAPDSGSKYALDEELYEMILSFENSADAEDGKQSDVVRSITEPLTEAIRKNVTTETVSGKLTALDGKAPVKVKVTKITGSNAMLEEIADVLDDIWRDNEAFYSLVRSMYPELSAEETNAQFERFVGELRNVSDNCSVNFGLTLYVRGAYMIGADAVFSYEEKDGGDLGEQRLEASLRFSEKPADNQSFELSAEGKGNGESIDLKLSYSSLSGKERKKAAGVLDRLELSLKQDLEFTDERSSYYTGTEIGFKVEGSEPAFTAQLDFRAYASEGTKNTDGTVSEFSCSTEGEYKSDNSFLSIGKVSFKKDGEERVFDKSSVSVSMLNDKIDRSFDFSDAIPVDRLTEENVDTLITDLDAQLDDLAEKMNKTLEAELFVKQATVAETGGFTVGSADYLSCYDPSTDRLFVLARQSYSADLSVLDGTTMQVIAEKRLPYKIHAMDADNGRLAYTRSYDFTVYFLDENTLEQTDEKKVPEGIFPAQNGDYLKNLVIDGDTMYVTKEDQHCDIMMIDIPTWEAKTLDLMYSPWLRLDKQHHVLAASETGLSRSNLLLFNSMTGELLPTSENVSVGFASGIPYMCGNAVLWESKYVSYEGGAEVSLYKLAPEIPFIKGFTVYALIRTSDLITAALIVSTDGSMGYTAFFSKDGTEVYDTGLLITDSLPGKPGVLYGISQSGLNGTLFTRFEFGEDYTLNLSE